ncbi:MAG: hypothetical protein ACI9BO_002563 [Zhongshania sp.]|jgi:hypothetical protein
MSLSSLAIIALPIMLLSANSSFADAEQDSKLSLIANIWSSLSNTLNNKQSNLGAWPAPILTATQFQIKTDAAELSFSRGDKVIFTLSPGGLSFNATF